MLGILLLTAGLSCGVYRAPQKSLSDLPKLEDVVDLSILELTLLERPSETSDRTPVERKVVRTKGFITAFKAEEDGDYHVVLSDRKGNTVVVEVISPDCSKNDTYREKFTSVKATFDKHLHAGRQFKVIDPMPVEVTGVVFFDKMHHQRGLAPNGVELHPLLSIDFR